ncbi:hypothetical protein DSO57_1008123 [Entomophthora muscae]|uniref:Uncharacterized protein n=1 Tax=Entomophthora muscae TaxID=34485 RepID=A0ACC2TU52_9FUNG|nr:hypothetical protein DSO57_1008123 [Entomophthora muscae]
MSHTENKESKENVNLATESTVLALKSNQQDAKPRLSLYKRGQRISSMKPGRMGYPHSTIKTDNYYKHIPSELPEPARLKQLISWLVHYFIEKQVSSHEISLEAAKEAEMQFLNDLQEGKLDLNWYTNPKKDDVTKTVINPVNTSLKRKLAEVEEDYMRIKKEYKSWKSMLKEETALIEKPKFKANDTSKFDIGEPWLSRLKELEAFQVPALSPDVVSAVKKLEQNTDLLSQTLDHVLRQQSNIVEECNKVLATINKLSRDPALSDIDPFFVLRALQRNLPPYFPF